MKRLNKLLFMVFFASLFGCAQTSKNENNDKVVLEEITSRTDTSEGFSDIFLRITEETKTDSSHIYIAKGLYKKKVIGLKFEVKSNMPNGITPEGEINSKSGIIYQAVKINSIGKESDDFVNALGELYSFPTTKEFTKKQLVATAFSLNREETELAKSGYYKFKLFFEEENESLYAELYFNINTNEKIIELHEKDQDYREPLIKVFTQ